MAEASIGDDETAPNRAEPIPGLRGLQPEQTEIQRIAKEQVDSWQEIAAALGAAAEQVEPVRHPYLLTSAGMRLQPLV